MKIATKILMILVLSIVALSLTFTSFAEVGGFVQSPSANSAPSLVDSSSDDHDCDEPLIVISYADRAKLPEADRAKIEKAYSKINGVKNLTSICSGLKTLAEELGIPTANLAISDLFDISDKHGDVGDAKFDVTLSAETLDNFVALLHFVDGKWVIVDNAEVTYEDGEARLDFTTDGLSPFAVVVDTGEELAPADNTALIVILVIISVAEAAVLITILVKFLLSKKTA